MGNVINCMETRFCLTADIVTLQAHMVENVCFFRTQREKHRTATMDLRLCVCVCIFRKEIFVHTEDDIGR